MSEAVADGQAEATDGGRSPGAIAGPTDEAAGLSAADEEVVVVDHREVPCWYGEAWAVEDGMVLNLPVFKGCSFAFKRLLLRAIREYEYIECGKETWYDVDHDEIITLERLPPDRLPPLKLDFIGSIIEPGQYICKGGDYDSRLVLVISGTVEKLVGDSAGGGLCVTRVLQENDCEGLTEFLGVGTEQRTCALRAGPEGARVRYVSRTSLTALLNMREPDPTKQRPPGKEYLGPIMKPSWENEAAYFGILSLDRIDSLNHKASRELLVWQPGPKGSPDTPLDLLSLPGQTIFMLDNALGTSVSGPLPEGIEDRYFFDGQTVLKPGVQGDCCIMILRGEVEALIPDGCQGVCLARQHLPNPDAVGSWLGEGRDGGTGWRQSDHGPAGDVQQRAAPSALQGKRVSVWGLFQPRSHVKTALAGAGGGAGPGPVGVTLARLASSATWWRNPPEAMSDTSDTSELAPEAVDPIEPDRFGLRWQGASPGSPGGATAWLLTLPAAGRIILLTAEGVIEGGVASPGRGVTGGRAITLDPDTVRAHPPRLFERLNGTEGKVHLCRTLPCTRIHLSSDTGNYRSPLVHAMAFARCPESDPAPQLDLGAVWTECRTGAPQPALLDASIETDLPPVAIAAPEGVPAEEAQGSDRPPTPRMSWFLDHTFDTTAAQAWYSKVAAKLKWTSQVPLGDHDSQIIQHLSDPKVAFSILAVLCVVTYSSLFPGPVPGGVLGSALYYTARIAAVVASWVWHIGAAFMGPVVSSLVFGSVGAWCAMSAGIVAASSVGAAAFVNVCSRAAAAATHAFGPAAGSAGVNAGAAPSSGPAPTSGAAEGPAPGGARLGIAKTSEAAPTVGSCPCSAPGVKWSTEAGPQQLAQWCAANASESLPLLRVDAEHFVLPFGCNPIVDGCIGVCRLHHKVYKQTRWSGKCVFPDTCLELGRPVKEYLLPGSPTVGMICMKHVISSLRTQDTLPEWVSRVQASVRGSTSLQEACDGSAGRPGLEGIVAELADEWSMRLAAAWGRVASQCPHEWVLQLAARFGDTPVPRSDATAPSPPLRPEAPVWSPFAGPAQHSGYGSCSPAPKLPLASHDLTAQSMFHGSVVPQDDGPRHPRLAGMMGLHGSGTVPLGPQDHSWSPVPLAGSMPAERHVWDPYRDPNGLASLGGGMIGQSPPTAHHGMSSNPMMPGTPVMTGGLASFGIHPGGVAPHGPNLWPQGQMGSAHLPSWGPSHGPNPHDSMHGLASAIGSLQLVLSKGNEDVVRQLERSNRKDEARGGDRHTIAGITREDELLKFALGGCDTQPVDCPVKIDFYVALAVSLCSWGIPEDGESPKVYLDAKDFPALGADELQRWRAPPVSDSVLRASGRDPLTIEWRRFVRNVIRLSGLEDPDKSHVRRICQTLGPDGAPVVQPPKVFDLEDPEGHFQKVIYARMQRNVHQALWANAYELGNPKPGARIGGDAAYPQGPKIAPQITRLATKHTDVGRMLEFAVFSDGGARIVHWTIRSDGVKIKSLTACDCLLLPRAVIGKALIDELLEDDMLPYNAAIRVLEGGQILDAFGFPIGDGKAKNVPDCVEKSEVFRACSSHFVEQMPLLVEDVAFWPGERIYTQYDEGNFIYFIRAGRVKIEVLGRREAQIVDAGHSLGDMAVLDQVPHYCESVTAETHCWVRILHKTLLHRSLSSFPEEEKRIVGAVQNKGGGGKDEE
ncbi:unnamed protein product [Polarella glacialis]|uniref:Cyclic nucleotide-binding domain-containing protein n=2 Tax=Polarella glacialis TaxID=89957 RepID=A0A813LXQ0_POLGL|nr:unnamed protein product [Polarella glacialis]